MREEVSLELCPEVYPPSEDSYLTCMGVALLISSLRRLSRRDRVDAVEVGSGTGIVTLHLVRDCTRRGTRCRVVSIDVSLNASKCTLTNVRLNGIDDVVDVMVCDDLSCIKDSYRPDIVVSNPPYLPEEIPEICEPSYCGGADGRLVIDRLLRHAARIRTILILTQSSLSRPDITVQFLKEHCCDVVIVGATHVFFEDILVFACICY